MNAVDFFENACETVASGEAVDTQEFVTTSDWLHADALAKRLGFEVSPLVSGVYYSRRQKNSLTLRWLRREDFDHWLILFQACFGRSISLEHWQWKYRSTKRLGIAAFDGRRLVAFYGGMPRTMFATGRRIEGIQVGDVMVHPDFRSSLTRTGPFQMVASTFLEQNLSFGSPYEVGFGFPNQRAFKVAERLGLYRKVDDVVQLNWNAEAFTLPPWLAVVAQPPDIFLQSTDRIWAEMKAGFRDSIIGVRDTNYLKARYVDEPNANHQWHGLRNRLTGRVVSIAICKILEDGLEVLDLLGDPGTFPMLLRGVFSDPTYADLPNIFMWITKSHVHLLSKLGGRLTELGICVPTNTWAANIHAPTLDGRWWLTGGDTDFR